MKLDLFSECAGGHYNKSGGCQKCGHCAGVALCDKHTGYCPSCEPGWIFPLCQQRKSFYFSLFCFYSSPLHPPPPPPIPPFLRPAGWLQTSTACPNCFPRVGCVTCVCGPSICRNDLPLPLPKKPSLGPFTSNFQAFLFSAMFSRLTLLVFFAVNCC